MARCCRRRLATRLTNGRDMTLVRIATVVEGHGEVTALPVVLRRLAAEIAPACHLDLLRPYRQGRDSLIKSGGIESIVESAFRQIGDDGRILILLDADDACPASLAPELLARACSARPRLAFSIVLANREFEAWFLAAAPSIAGCRGLADSLQAPTDPEAPRDCKGWLTEHRIDGRPYKPVADQAALAARFDLHLARSKSASFDKLWRDMERLMLGENR